MSHLTTLTNPDHSICQWIQIRFHYESDSRFGEIEYGLRLSSRMFLTWAYCLIWGGSSINCRLSSVCLIYQHQLLQSLIHFGITFAIYWLQLNYSCYCVSFGNWFLSYFSVLYWVKLWSQHADTVIFHLLKCCGCNFKLLISNRCRSCECYWFSKGTVKVSTLGTSRWPTISPTQNH